MKERMAYKFRIYPDEAQARLFRRTIGCCRVVYNTCLEQKRLERERSDPRRLTAVDQNKQLGDLKAALPWMKEVPHHCLQQAVIDLHRAFTNFFEGRAACPKPRRKYRNESFRFPDPKQIMFRDGEIFLPQGPVGEDGRAPRDYRDGEERDGLALGRPLVRLDPGRARSGRIRRA
jgi:putative transposase